MLLAFAEASSVAYEVSVGGPVREKIESWLSHYFLTTVTDTSLIYAVNVGTHKKTAESKNRVN